VRRCEIHDVQVVTHAGSVSGRIVAAEYGELVAQTRGGLGYIGHERFRFADRQLADPTARVRADGVEVAQGDAPERGPRGRDVVQDRLAHLFGATVR
jgi:hypothetical protein